MIMDWVILTILILKESDDKPLPNPISEDEDDEEDEQMSKKESNEE